MPPSRDDDAYLIEFQRVGLYVKASAIDPVTNTEVSIVGDARASREELTRVVVRKLEYVIKKKQARAPPCGSSYDRRGGDRPIVRGRGNPGARGAAGGGPSGEGGA